MTEPPDRHLSGMLHFPLTLEDRVRGRVAQAGRALDEKSRGQTSQLRPTLSIMPADGPGVHPNETRELRSLFRVFRELLRRERDNRTETGRPEDRDLRVASLAFREQPSVAALTRVAAFLEQRSLLAW